MKDKFLFPSRSRFGIPELDINGQPERLELPALLWGSGMPRKKVLLRAATVLFYTSDYRFEQLWADPSPLAFGLVNDFAEINFSVYDQMPLAEAIYQIYRKRVISRYLQGFGKRIWVDLNVSPRFYSLNLHGVPRGWKRFITRGYTERLPSILDEYALARKVADGSSGLQFAGYGGGYKVKELCRQHGLIWIPEEMDRIKQRRIADG